MTTYYITATKYQGGKLTVHRKKPAVPHYVVNCTTEAVAVRLTEGYRIGYHWACEQALAGDIRIDSGEVVGA